MIHIRKLLKKRAKKQEIPVWKIPAQEVPVQEVPVQEVPAQDMPVAQQVKNLVPASDYQCVACGKIGYLPEGTIICWECQQILKED